MPRYAPRLVGYMYDADTHCTDCAVAYYTYRAPASQTAGTRMSEARSWDVLPDGLVDSDGNAPSPIMSDYSADSWCGHAPDSPGELPCGDCGGQVLFCEDCWDRANPYDAYDPDDPDDPDDADNGCTCETCDAFRVGV